MKSLTSALTVLVLASMALSGCVSDDIGGGKGNPQPSVPPLPVGGIVTPENMGLLPLGNLTPSFELLDVGKGALEPTLGVDSKGTIYMIAGTFILKSSDHGRTWKDVTPKAAGQNIPPTTLDPMIYVDPVTDRVFYDHLYLACTYLSYSDDGGATWIPNPLGCGLPVVDHQTLAAGPSKLPATAYHNRAVYLCANQLAGATCSVSYDGGLTFPVKNDVFGGGCGGITGHVVVGPDGTVYLPAWRCDKPYLGISRDGGITWESKLMDPTISSGEMDPSVAVAKDNSVYYFWMDLKGQPFLKVSKDGGRTFGPAIRFDDLGLTVTNLPAITAGDAGRIAFTYIGTSHGKAVNPSGVHDDATWDLFMTYSTDALSETPNFTTIRLNKEGSPVHKGPCSGGYRCGSIVDFMDIEKGPDGRIYVASVDSAGTKNGVLGVLLEGPSLFADKGWLTDPHAASASMAQG
jgi:hypothetical protein